MKSYVYLTALFFLLKFNVLYAGSPVKVQQFINHKDWNFVENKGQIPLSGKGAGGFNTEIKYYGHQGGVYLYCKPGLLSFVFTKVESKTTDQISEATGSGIVSPFGGGRGRNFQPQPSQISTSRTDLVLLNSNPNAQITATDKQEYYEDYYTTGDADHGITNVRTYKTVTYKSIYPHIDMVLQTKEQGMEYSFIVHPGGKVGDIQLQWNGTETTKVLSNGGFKFSNSLGTLEESAPKSFVQGKMVKSSIINEDYNYGFRVGRYNEGKNLVIDPTLEWATYFGGSGYDEALNVSTDRSGNILVTGYTVSTSGIGTSGTYQSSFAGGSLDGDPLQVAYLAKFSPAGNRLWGTYFAGSSNNDAYGIAADSSGSIFIAGGTNSGNMATSGAYQTSFNSSGYGDAYIAKFNSAGKIIWSTYYGGNENEGATALALDDSGNVFIAGETQSTTGIATSGAIQSSYLASLFDYSAFVAKFSASGALKWGSYFGGSGNTDYTQVTYSKSGYIYLEGHTSSSGLATSGVYETSPCDNYLAKITSSGKEVWATYFMAGNPSYDGESVAADNSGNVFVTGTVTSSNGHSTNYFLAKFTPSGKLDLSSTYGDNGINIYGTGVATDQQGNVYLSAYTDSYDPYLIDQNAYQDTLKGENDAYFAKFDSSCHRLWATYFGGNLEDYCTSIAVDSSGNATIAGYTSSNTGIATHNGYQRTLAGSYDVFMAKFIFPKLDASVRKIFSPKTRSCSGLNNTIIQLYNAGYTDIDSVTINWSINKKIQKPYKWKGRLKGDSSVSVNIGTYNFSAGIDTIFAWTSKPNSISDTITTDDSAMVIDTVSLTPSPNAGSNQMVCNGSKVNFGSTPVSGNQYMWSSVPSGFTSTLSDPTDTPKVPTTFYLFETVSATGCTAEDSVKIGFLSSPTQKAGINQTICIGDSLRLENTSTSGHTYLWTSAPAGFSSSLSSLIVKPSKSITYYLLETVTSTGCTKMDTVNITVDSLPAATYSTMVGNCSVVVFEASPLKSTPVSIAEYSWSGQGSPASNPLNITGSFGYYQYHESGIYDYSLTVEGTNGCKKVYSDSIKAKSLISLHLPGDTTLCSNYYLPINAIVLNAVKPYVITWSSGDTGTIIVKKVSKDTSFTAYIKDANGCTSGDTIAIKTKMSPIAEAGSNQTVCQGTGILIGVKSDSGITYQWSSEPSGFYSAASNPIVTPESTITYKLLTINNLGCTGTDSVMISVNALPQPKVLHDTSVCYGGTVLLGTSADSLNTYSWTSSPSGFSSTSSIPSVSPKSATRYKLTETDSNDCSATDSVTITVNSLPTSSIISNSVICSGASIAIGDTSVPGNSYSWTSTTPGFSSSSSNPSVSPTSTTNYKLTETTSKGCSITDSVKIIVDSLPKSNFSFSNVCPGDSSPFTDSSYLANSYLWNFGDSGTSSLANPKHLYSSVGNYTVYLKVTSSSGCTDSVSKTLSLSSCVWPGDANGDKVVDMKDLLAIGTVYGSVGHPRPNASINWTGQPSPDWDSIFDNGSNYKNADCNGDSIVNDKDTLAISANYGLSHSKSGGLNQGNASDPGFNIKYLKDTFYAGDTLIAQIILGSTAKPITNLYGLAFSIALDPAIFQSNKAFLKVTPSFLGTNGTDLIAMTKNNTSAGTMDIGICRINQQNASGNGAIATLFLPVNPTLSQKYLKASLSLSNNNQISYNQKPVSLYLTSDSVLVKQDHTGIENAKSNDAFLLSIFPNPFQSTTTISYNLNHNSRINITLFDITGKEIGTIINENEVPGGYQFDINAEKYHLSPGIYLMKFMMDDEVASRRLVKF